MGVGLSWAKARSIFSIIWPLVGTLVLLVTLWATFAATVESNTRRIETIEVRMDILGDIQMDIRETKTDIQWLKEWAKHNGGTP
jgi:hypothetical protein